jgi:hypothetical protein
VNAQIKIFEDGGIAIGSTNYPGADIIKFDKSVVFDQDFTFTDNVTFNQTVTLNNGTNLFESYWGSGGGGLTLLGTAGTLSMFPDGAVYKFNTSKDLFIFEDKVQCGDGLSVTPGGPSNFYSTTTFNTTVNVGQSGTMATANFYGNVVFHLANPSATFVSNMPGEFSEG